MAESVAELTEYDVYINSYLIYNLIEDLYMAGYGDNCVLYCHTDDNKFDTSPRQRTFFHKFQMYEIKCFNHFHH